MKQQGVSQPAAYKAAGFPGDIRRYDIVAKIIRYYRITSVVLITSNKLKERAISDLDIKVANITDVSDFFVLGDEAENRVAYIKAGTYKPIVDKNKSDKWIFVIGDLNVDYMYSPAKLSPNGVILDKPEPLIGGTAFNAAIAFKAEGFSPIIFGKIGDDVDGQFIRNELENRKGIISLVGVSNQLRTGSCSVIIAEDTKQRLLLKENHNANNYDLKHLKQALALSDIGVGVQGHTDIIFIVGHFFVRQGLDHSTELMNIVADSKAKIILDLVPHNIYETVTLSDFNKAIGNHVSMLIGEYNTLMQLIEHPIKQSEPQSQDIISLFASLPVEFLVLRYGVGNISKQMVCRRISSHENTLQQMTKVKRARQLHSIFDERFSQDDLIVFTGIFDCPYDNLEGHGKTAKIMSFIQYIETRNLLDELIIVGRQQRPDISWPDIKNYEILESQPDTGYINLLPDQRRGYGDVLTARLLLKYKDLITGTVLL